MREAKGDFTQFLDADDLLSSNKIEEQVRMLSGNADKVATCATVHFFDGEDIGNEQLDTNNPFLFDCETPSNFLLNLYGGNGEGGMITIHSWLAPKKLIERAGYWNEKLSLDDDGEFFCRVLLASDGILFAKNVINYYRKYSKPVSLSSQVNFKSITSALESLKLKENHLANYQDDIRYKKAFALAYKRLAVQTYPRFKDISKFCEERMNKLGGSNHDVTIGGKQIEFVKRIAGWKLARRLQHYFQKGFN